MKKLIAILCLAGIGMHMTGCAGAGSQTTAEKVTVDVQESKIENTQSFDADKVEVSGYLQNIEVSRTTGDKVVIRWSAAETEAIMQEDGRVWFSTEDPSRKKLEDAPLAANSTIHVEVPDSVTMLQLSTIVGDISLSDISFYDRLTAETVDGNITVTGMTGSVEAQTRSGIIGPDVFVKEIIKYDDYKVLQTVIPGDGKEDQEAYLNTESGNIKINQ